ncbi:MAG: hypothetical protein ACXWLH_02910 [Candidatus Saccharimonadales bacterium]
MSGSVTFETKCWEKDWQYVLDPVRLQSAISNNRYDFNEKIVYINNVQNLTQVKQQTKQLVDAGIITSYVVVDEFADQALKHFGITKKSFEGGYYYSIQELVGIYLCKTDYLLHFSSDSMPVEPVDWIDLAIKKLEGDHRIKVANLCWNKKYGQAKHESIEEDDNFYVGYGFSDQNYFIKVADYNQPIYNEKHLISERYPRYGGELFEKRIDAWLRNHDFRRITFKHGSYIHKNFENRTILQTAKLAPRKVKNYVKFVFGSTKVR